MPKRISQIHENIFQDRTHQKPKGHILTGKNQTSISSQYMTPQLLVCSILKNILMNLANFPGHHNSILLKNIGFSHGNTSQCITSMTWVGNVYVQSLFSVWEQWSDDKKVIYLQRQSLIFIHNIIELKGMWGILLSHQQGLWATCETSWVFLKLCVASNESSLLIGSYFWLAEGLSLELEVRWPWELCSNKALSYLEGELKLNVFLSGLGRQVEIASSGGLAQA